MLHISPTNYHLLAAKQMPCQKAYLLTKNFDDFSGGKSQKNGLVSETKKRRKKREKKEERIQYKSNILYFQ